MKKSFLEKMFEIDSYIEEKNKQRKTDEKAFKMPIGKLIFSPFGYFIDYFKNISIITITYSLVITILSALMGYTFICGIPGVELTNLNCSSFGLPYFIYLALKFLVMIGFIICFYNIVSGKEFNIKHMLKFDILNLKVLGAFVFWALLNIVPLISLQVLIARVPNPDWRIEAVFFTIIGSGFLVPFILMRFYSVFGYFIECGKIYPLGPIWEKTKGNGLKIIIGLSLIVLFSILAIVNYYVNFKAAFDTRSIWFSAITSEFVYNIMMFLITGLLVGHIYVQRAILIDDTEDQLEPANEK